MNGTIALTSSTAASRLWEVLRQWPQLAAAGRALTVSFTDEESKSREQEKKYHAMCGDIAKVCQFMGQKWDCEDWKRLLVDAFGRVKAAEGDPLNGWGRMVPSLDGTGFVQLGFQTRRFKKHQASEFIEYLYAYGAEHDVHWSDASMTAIREAREDLAARRAKKQAREQTA